MLRMAQRLFPDMQPPGHKPAERPERLARGADVPVAPDVPRGKQLERPKRLDPTAPQDPDVQLQAILMQADQTGRRVREVAYERVTELPAAIAVLDFFQRVPGYDYGEPPKVPEKYAELWKQAQEQVNGRKRLAEERARDEWAQLAELMKQIKPSQ
jgi:hypothetical protein